MRQVLVLGGTAWLGREIARAALAHGAEVTCLARGNAGAVPPGARLVRADRTHPAAYAAVQDRVWDDVIELSYDLDFVRPALDALAGRAEHWSLVSSISVYADDTTPGGDERAAVVEPVDLDSYAHAKVAAERASMDAPGPALLIARPGLIAGPGDPSDRFGYWPGRFALAGEDGHPVLVPDVHGRAAQVIDVRDLAEWIVRAGAAGTSGVVNAVGDVHALAEALDVAARAAGFEGERVTASDAALIEAGVNFWAGPHSLPLWIPAEKRGFNRHRNDAFRASGGMLRPLAETITDVLHDERARGLDRPRRAGLRRAEERAVLAQLGAPRGDGSGASPKR